MAHNPVKLWWILGFRGTKSLIWFPKYRAFAFENKKVMGPQTWYPRLYL